MTNVTLFWKSSAKCWCLTYTYDGVDTATYIEDCVNKSGHQEALVEARKIIGDIPIRVRG